MRAGQVLVAPSARRFIPELINDDDDKRGRGQPVTPSHRCATPINSGTLVSAPVIWN